ncbi:uncharacterized protein [Ranitomeya imitator]|uniref:uncharacterized protein n=1 Tax=Ranitomeya imitator TaxID=111125 RepID=UPI0037E844AA
MDWEAREAAWQAQSADVFAFKGDTVVDSDFVKLTTELTAAHRTGIRLWWNIRSLEEYIRANIPCLYLELGTQHRRARGRLIIHLVAIFYRRQRASQTPDPKRAWAPRWCPRGPPASEDAFRQRTNNIAIAANINSVPIGGRSDGEQRFRKLVLRVLHCRPHLVNGPDHTDQQIIQDLIQLLQENEDGTVTFLDLEVLLDSGSITTKLFRKPTATNSLLDFRSFHPFHTRMGVPTGQFLRVRRNCTNDLDFQEEARELSCRFKDRHYPRRSISRAYQRARSQTQVSLLEPKTKVVFYDVQDSLFGGHTYMDGVSGSMAMEYSGLCISSHWTT